MRHLVPSPAGIAPALFTAAFLTLAGDAAASDLVVPLPNDVLPDRVTTSYDCAGRTSLAVDYISAGPISLAIVPVEGDPLVFANVIAGSGARYAAGPYVWWTKGKDAELYDLRNGEGAPPVICTEK